MVCAELIIQIKNKFPAFNALEVSQAYADEVRLKVEPSLFKNTCLTLHKILPSPVMMFFAEDQRAGRGCFVLNCQFVSFKKGQWVSVYADIPDDQACFESLARDIYSASLFEREIQEMFGILPQGNPDLRRLNLHDETWPQGNFPLRKDFRNIQPASLGEYKFAKIEGEGIFEIPVGPVHAGIIAPGHFRFSAAGEPIVNLEIRLGFTHRGVEKLFEKKAPGDCLRLSEAVAGDSAFSHSLAFTMAAEKISALTICAQASYLRAIFLELERAYNHLNSIGGIATDVGFSFPSAFAAILKEEILQLNQQLSGSRYLKNINLIGGIASGINQEKRKLLLKSLKAIKRDFEELVKILYNSVSFMDRVESTGLLHRKTAEDLGIVGLAARASGIPTDLRQYFPSVYQKAGFQMAREESGDALARLNIRVAEFRQSIRLIEEFTSLLKDNEEIRTESSLKPGSALGYVEAWRGPVLYWLKINEDGLIERCKIVDASFHNWQALAYAVLGNIIPDFPLCNKSFDLSYTGNDL
ncbi:MAG: NADH-quinone oxidoreductase subunit C [Candidatus Omnitrophica bacterium]|nr:NADH-quinone oxidoreductase subunit C [Candidatus Omnitrophota bacterium]